MALAHGVLIIWASVCGMTRIDEAKMTGMTPAVLTRSGRYVFAPP